MKKKVVSNEVYYYLRGRARGPAPKGMKKEQQNGPPLITVCLSQLPDDTICQGVAICGSKDAPSKKEGRRIARNYMLKAVGTKKSSSYVRRGEADEVCFEVGRDFTFHSFFDLRPTIYEQALLDKNVERRNNSEVSNM